MLTEQNNYQIRPYARLLTMLGEQLITDERIALIELIKNAYDADAKWVKVSFVGFGDNFEIKKESKIVIEDSGDGMTEDVILNHWLNPATPIKVKRKRVSDRTKSGRIIQGEKGIGRFALLKLGRKIIITTRATDEKFEYVIKYDFSAYDDDFLTENGIEKDIFLDQLPINIIQKPPEIITRRKISLGTRKIERPDHGTFIEISNLKGSWSDEKIEYVYNDIIKLEPIFSKLSTHNNFSKNKEFEILIYQENVLQRYNEEYIQKLNFLLENRPVISIEDGYFNSQKQIFEYKENNVCKSLELSNVNVTGLLIFKRFKNAGNGLNQRILDCGDFHFAFYIFDLGHNVPPKYELDYEDKKIIKSHRIYLYRDGLRVYPYGGPDDDWLKIDQLRGTVSAGFFLSNDQVVGYVEITSKGNPKLKDKTNREGLLEEGNTTADFIELLQIFLAYIRAKPYARYLQDNKKKKDADIFKSNQVQNEFEKLRDKLGGDTQKLALLSNIEKTYKTERSYLQRRAEITENLAGVGLSVETASHDILAIMQKVYANIDGLITDLVADDDVDKEELLKELQTIRGGMGFVEAQLRDIQLLFTSSKQRRKSIRVLEIIEKVEKIYKRSLDKDHIDFSVQSTGSPLIAKTTDAVILQLLLNLFDNSVYWLQQTTKSNKQILISLNGDSGEMIFSDNGPGVNKEDVPYIFEPFYSGKGEDGRGLGLYIARQLLERNSYSIELGELKSQRILSGANFVVTFVEEDK